MNNETMLSLYVMRLADDALCLGHLLSAWASRGPTLEEDLALTNLALDSLGHCRSLLELVVDLDSSLGTPDELVFFRNSEQFRSLQIMEIPVAGDFALTVAKHVLVDSYRVCLYEALLPTSYSPLAALAAKILQELRYHERHSHSWLIRLGLGTEESRQRMIKAFATLQPYLAEMFAVDELEVKLNMVLAVPLRRTLFEKWKKAVNQSLQVASLPLVESNCSSSMTTDAPPILGESNTVDTVRGWIGLHSPFLEPMLLEMQSVARQIPGAKW